MSVLVSAQVQVQALAQVQLLVLAQVPLLEPAQVWVACSVRWVACWASKWMQAAPVLQQAQEQLEVVQWAVQAVWVELLGECLAGWAIWARKTDEYCTWPVRRPYLQRLRLVGTRDSDESLVFFHVQVVGAMLGQLHGTFKDEAPFVMPL